MTMQKRISFIPIGYAYWLAMMAVHESGHVIAAVLTGGHVQRVILPLWGFSRTDVSPNPNRLLEVSAGPVWGFLLPTLICFLVRKPWRIWQGFAGFCLIANGSYLAAGWSMHAGDAWEMVQLGIPRWGLVCVGSAAVTSGLWLWHRLGKTELL